MESFMQDFQIFVGENVHLAPYTIFGLLLLAGFNIPVSEDLMIFTSAVLASSHPEYLYKLFTGLYLGAYFSDLICFGIGSFLGTKIWKIRFLASMISRERLDKLNSFYNRYGIVTLIFGRFIPFGVRNGLFLTAGIGKMNFIKFALSDLLACTISVVIYFYLYYTFGSAIIEQIKTSNKIIFGVAIIFISVMLLKKKFSKK